MSFASFTALKDNALKDNPDLNLISPFYVKRIVYKLIVFYCFLKFFSVSFLVSFRILLVKLGNIITFYDKGLTNIFFKLSKKRTKSFRVIR